MEMPSIPQYISCVFDSPTFSLNVAYVDCEARILWALLQSARGHVYGCGHARGGSANPIGRRGGWMAGYARSHFCSWTLRAGQHRERYTYCHVSIESSLSRENRIRTAEWKKKKGACSFVIAIYVYVLRTEAARAPISSASRCVEPLSNVVYASFLATLLGT